MNPFSFLGRALDALWSIIDPDEPLFCECAADVACADCALAAPFEPAVDWPGAPA